MSTDTRELSAPTKSRTKSVIKIGTAVAAPGEKMTGVLPLAARTDGSTYDTPVTIVNGSAEGPNLWVHGAIHGDEYDGSRAIADLVRELDPRDVHGALIAIPVLNIGAFQARQRTNPLDSKDLNRIFPGNPAGTVTDQIAHALMTLILDNADYLVDLHGGGNEALMSFHAVFYDDAQLEASRTSERMARAIGAPVIQRSFGVAFLEGSLWYQLTRQGIPTVLFEAGGTGGPQDEYIALHREGLRRLMHLFEMIPGSVAVDEKCHVLNRHRFIASTKGGFFRAEVKPGTHVRPGDVLGRVVDLFGTELEVVRAPAAGIALGMRTYATCHAGSMVVNFSEFDQ